MWPSEKKRYLTNNYEDIIKDWDKGAKWKEHDIEREHKAKETNLDLDGGGRWKLALQK